MDQATIDTLRQKPVAAQRLFIGGDFADSRDGATLPVISPIDGTVLTSIADAGAHDVDRAVSAARAAFEKEAGRERLRRCAGRCCCVWPT